MYQAMHNRIKVLQESEQKSKVRQKQVEIKAEKMLEARKRHFDNLSARMDRKKTRNDQIYQLHEQNWRDRVERKASIENKTHELLANNKQKHEEKFRSVEHARKIFDSQKYEEEWRKESWAKVYNHKHQFKKFREHQVIKKDYDLLNSYGEKISKKMVRMNSLSDRISKMEKRER